VADDNDSLGDSVKNFPSAASAVGDHTLRSKNYELDYTVRRAPPGAGACGADVFSPRSRFDRRRRARRAGRRRIVVKGRTSDLACRGHRGRVRRTQVALTLKRGSRSCRYATRIGRRVRLRRRTSCRRPVWLAVRGAARWRLSVRGRFPRGRYVAFSRSIDSEGNVEYRRTRANRLSFHVR
jgi:hypothetical protein